MAERTFNLVVPLAHEATDMRMTDTAGSAPGRSGAVTRLNARSGDVESTTVILTADFNRAYIPSVTKTKVIGGESPNVRGDKPHSVCHAAFLSPWCVLNGRPGGGSRKARRRVPGLSTSVSVAHPGERGLAVHNRNRSTRIMSNDTKVDRKTASRINPLISSIWTEDTLDTVASVIYEIGFMVSETNLAKEHTFAVFDAISAALRWEVDNIDSVRQARKKTGVSHG